LALVEKQVCLFNTELEIFVKIFLNACFKTEEFQEKPDTASLPFIHLDSPKANIKRGYPGN
jgi:hypothetical protein